MIKNNFFTKLCGVLFLFSHLMAHSEDSPDAKMQRTINPPVMNLTVDAQGTVTGDQTFDFSFTRSQPGMFCHKVTRLYLYLSSTGNSFNDPNGAWASKNTKGLNYTIVTSTTKNPGGLCNFVNGHRVPYQDILNDVFKVTNQTGIKNFCADAKSKGHAKIQIKYDTYYNLLSNYKPKKYFDKIGVTGLIINLDCK